MYLCDTISFRGCNETYDRWPLGSSSMCYMDSWYNHLIDQHTFFSVVLYHIITTYFSFLNLKLVSETCLKDVKRMEPIDGLSKINKVFIPFLSWFWLEFLEHICRNIISFIFSPGPLETSMQHLQCCLWSLHTGMFRNCFKLILRWL
jgi:hypothetical protein